jgi:hypothetical protein
MISMNQVWDDSIAFLRRERALLIPLAGATLLVGDVLSSLAQAGLQSEEPSPARSLALLVGVVIALVGQLSITALVLRSGLSVGEALLHGLRRLPKVALVGMLLGFAGVVVLLPFLFALRSAGIDLANAQNAAAMPPWIGVAFLVLTGALLWLAVRLAMMNALIVDTNPPVIATIRGAFALTKGIAARLALVFVVYIVVVLIVSSAARFVLGSLFTLAGAAMGSPFAGLVLTSVTTGLITTTLSTIAIVYIAMLYGHVVRRETASTFR